ncbi:type IV pilus assembly protein PilM [Cohnella lupini]|uniref:Type IV pilus assembly protein PilM n=2 Tax=Cohnella lupini TaxID=1294267 RepID=A0A3D9IJ32_9BACL|nr:type IV pilus assembly protein PilM [Cohnella lupini]
MTLDQTGARYAMMMKRNPGEIERSGYLPLPQGTFNEDQITNPQQLGDLLSEWVKSEKLKGSSVHISIPSSHIIIRRLTIPSVSDKEVAQLLALEIETTLHLPFEDPVYDYVTIEKDESSTHTLVFAASKKLIQSYVDLMGICGLKVKGVEISATALARAIASAREETLKETMLIHLNSANLEINMFHDGYPVFVRSIHLFEETVAEEGVISPGQLSEIMSEISRMLNFYQFSIHDGNSKIKQAIIVGSEAGSSQLLAELAQTQSEISAGIAEFEDVNANKSALGSDIGRVAMGLALQRGSRQRINLMPGTDKDAKSLPVILSVLAIAWVIGLAAAGYTYMDNKSVLSNKEDQIKRLDERLLLLENGLMAINQQDGQAARTNPLEVIEKVREHRRDAIAAMKELNDIIPAGGQLVSIQYNGAEQITLTVVLPDIESASRYLFDLRRTTFADNAQLQNLSEETPAVLRSPESEEELPEGAPGVTVSAGISKQVASYSVQFKKAEVGNDGIAP